MTTITIEKSKVAIGAMVFGAFVFGGIAGVCVGSHHARGGPRGGYGSHMGGMMNQEMRNNYPRGSSTYMGSMMNRMQNGGWNTKTQTATVTAQ